MPRVTCVAPALAALLHEQDGVVTMAQLAQHGFGGDAVYRRVRCGRWQRLLPTVILTLSGTPTRRQLLVAAWLWGGEGAAIDGIDALRWHGFDRRPPDSGSVHVVVPWGTPARSRGFVVVRRAMADIVVDGRGIVPYVDPSTAAIVAARNARGAPGDAAAVAILSRSLQLGLTTVGSLATARAAIGDKWCRRVDSALLAVGVGIRSPAENAYRELVLTSRLLPEPKWNQWLQLPDGGSILCVDALWDEVALVGEVIGKKYHAWGENYETTAVRKERLTAGGLMVVDATALRIRRNGQELLRNLERIHAQRPRTGLPPGVRIVAPPGLRTLPIAG